MNKLIIVFCTVALFQVFKATGQSTEKFEGNVSVRISSFPALVKYTYLQDPVTRRHIKHGSFRYSLKDKTKDHRITQNISGKYVNDKKDGEWIYRINQKDFKLLKPDQYSSGTIELVAAFNEGLPDGLWRYSANIKHRSGVKKKDKWVWENYSPEKQVDIILNFENGKLYDSLYFHFQGALTISGSVDKEGYMHGEWVWNYGDSLSVFLYENGLLKANKVYDSLGELIHEKEYDQIASMYNEYMETKNNNPEALKKFSFTVHETDILSDKNHIITQSIRRYIYHEDLFQLRNFPGDETCIYDKSTHDFKLNIGGIKVITFKNQLSTAQTKKYVAIDKHIRNIENHLFILNPLIKSQKLDNKSKNLVSLIQRNLAIARKYACIAETVKLFHDYNTGIQVSEDACRYQYELPEQLPLFKNRDELLTYILHRIKTLEEESYSWYSSLKSNEQE